jgi:protein-disulfide isomerase
MKSAAMKFLARGAALAACAALTLAASPPKPLEPAKTNWNARIGMNADGSHTLGNPDAPVKLTEYVSYTCSHCADFHRQSDTALRLTMVPKGQIQVTVANLLRNPIDATIAMLTTCGDPKRFWVRHNAFMGTQDKWLPKVEKMSRDQQQRWYQGEMPDRMRAVANDFDFYAKVEQWGMTRAQADRCLADKVVLDKLKQQQAAAQELGIHSTPSFVLNGKVQEFHDWGQLSQAIGERLAASRAGNT